MNNQPYSYNQPHQSYQHSETNNRSYSPDATEHQYPQGVLSNSPEQGYPQEETASSRYPSSSPEHEYQQQVIPQYSPDYQRPVYQGNQLPNNEQNMVPLNDMVRTSNMGSMHAENRYATYRDAIGNIVENHQQVFKDQNQIRTNIRYWTRAISYFLLGVLEITLLLRFIFRLLGANAYNSFIPFLYNVSYPFVAAFHGIFDARTVGNGVLEFSTLIAMLIYALIVWGIVTFVNVVFAPIQASRQSVTTSRRSQY